MNTNSKRTHSNEDTKTSPTKRQYRNENEKRRRDLFSQLIGNLEDILRIDKKSSSDDQTNKLDKASILHETATFLRKNHHKLPIETNVTTSNCRTATTTTTCDHINSILDFSWKPPSNIIAQEEWIQTIIESMHCFFLVAKSDAYNCQIVYVSPNISSLLDYSQDEILNRSLFEFILPRHHDQLRDYFLKDHRVLEICDVCWRRATVNEYEKCTIIGAFRQINQDKNEKYFMSIVKVNSLDKSSIINNQNSINEFTTRLNLHGRFIHIDPKAREFLGYNSHELIGHTHFDFVHPDDLSIIVRAHRIWKQNGNGKSEPYRFLTKGQQWVFLQTSCQVQVNSWSGKPESYICISNPLQNSSDSLQKPLSYVIPSYQMGASSIESSSTSRPISRSSSQTGNSSSDPQISLFLSHLENDAYRKNMVTKLNERLTCKRAEIQVREEEIKVIEDIIQFINRHESKISRISLSKTIDPCLNVPLTAISTTAIDRTLKTNPLIRQDNPNQINRSKIHDNSNLLESSSNGTMDQLSHRSSSMIIPNLSSIDNQSNRSAKDETIHEPLTSSLFSPPQRKLNLSSPISPFSILSHSSPIPSLPLCISPRSTESLSVLSLAIDNRSIDNLDNIIPINSSPQLITKNTNGIQIEQRTRTSSFNHSLSQSLLS